MKGESLLWSYTLATLLMNKSCRCWPGFNVTGEISDPGLDAIRDALDQQFARALLEGKERHRHLPFDHAIIIFDANQMGCSDRGACRDRANEPWNTNRLHLGQSYCGGVQE